ncbi:sulfotransferase [Luminiphilus sp.]|nr:sulfotransferase [Luminiphilus sp.]
MSVPHENLIIDCPVLSDAAPVVLGGIGGSGTRVVTQLLQSLGFDMGSDLNQSLDDLGFTALFKRPSLWPLEDHLPQLNEALSIYLGSRGQTNTSIPSGKHATRVAQLLDITRSAGEWIDTGDLYERQECLATPSKPTPLWGWKEPNTHMLLPFLVAALPNMKYIHVTRHGLDMAHSSNQTQLKLWGAHLLGRAVDTNSADDSLAFWCAAHDRLLQVKERSQKQILVLPFESLFEEPDVILTHLCNFLALPESCHPAKAAISTLQKPQSLGRHRNYSPLNVSSDNGKIFRKLGYPVDTFY